MTDGQTDESKTLNPPLLSKVGSNKYSMQKRKKKHETNFSPFGPLVSKQCGNCSTPIFNPRLLFCSKDVCVKKPWEQVIAGKRIKNTISYPFVPYFSKGYTTKDPHFQSQALYCGKNHCVKTSCNSVNFYKSYFMKSNASETDVQLIPPFFARYFINAITVITNLAY